MNAGADRGGLRLSLSLLVYIAAFISTLGLARQVLTDQDPFWHIAAGNWIIEHGAIPHSDVFSHSMIGAPWVAHEHPTASTDHHVTAAVRQRRL